MGLVMNALPAEAEILALLSVAELKASLRIGHSNEDALIKDCILAAYDWLAGEAGWLNRSVIATTWTLTAPAFSSRLELPRAAPAIAVASIKYLLEGVQETLDTDVYKVQLTGQYGWGYVTLAYDQEWPSGIDIDPEAVEIIYSAGMGATGAAVRTKYPAMHKAMALLAGDYFRNREDTFTDIRMVEIDRKIVNGVNRVAGRYRFMNNHG